MTRRWFSFSLLIAIALILGFGSLANAQTSSVTLPVTPDPSTCPIKTMPTIQDVLARAGITPVADSAASPAATEPAASPTPFVMPTGTLADQATIDAITSTLVNALACQNTGSQFAVVSFATDNYLKTVLGGIAITESDVAAMAASPVAIDPQMYASLVSVEQVTTFADGRVGALVGSSSAGEDPSSVQKAYLIFANQNGQWLIDEDITESVGAAATPTS